MSEQRGVGGNQNTVPASSSLFDGSLSATLEVNQERKRPRIYLGTLPWVNKMIRKH